MRRAVLLAPLATALVAAPAHAYRPFDQTDADVSALHELELELGPVGYTHDAAGGTYTPGFILNYGVVPRVELVFDAHHALLYGGTDPAARRRDLDTAMLAKGVAREGCLQGQPGVSIAVEAGALLPTVPAAGGVGAAVATIVSQRWRAATLHVNLEGDFTREHRFAFIGGAIGEGPIAWTVRPVVETYVAREADLPTFVSGLGGAIWRAAEHLDLDAAVRAGREGSQNVFEVRAGLTWTVGL
ncbi:MAG TPA: hypothetical protein VHL80_06450 [Polyangia bacterium]|nr:hypothetical protein [Polyangia bacterium]